MHLAQLNIGEILYPMDDPRMAGFAGRLALINQLPSGLTGLSGVWKMRAIWMARRICGCRARTIRW